MINRHGVFAELLLDSGQAFLLKLMIDVYKLLRDTKGKLISIPPQADGLVERFHRTLTDMLAKKV